MIKTSRQLKALVRNLTKGDSLQAQIIMRNYVMERFLERISLSKYRNNFILKRGNASICYGRIGYSFYNGY